MINFNEIQIFLDNKNIEYKSKIPINTTISGIGSILNSNKSQITFLNDIKYCEDLISTKAIACLISIKYVKYLPKSCFAIIVDNPYLIFAYLSEFFHNNFNKQNLKILSNYNNFTNENNKIGKNCAIYEDTIILKDNFISNNVSIGPNVKIGSSCIIHSNCSLSNCIIGDNCIIKSGAVIGQDGFGFTLKEKVLIYHTGKVIIGNSVNIGSNTLIDRGTLDSTIIETNVKLDNLVHIAHNVNIGEGTIIAALTGIAGGTHIGKNCIMGGQVGINGHINIGDNVTIAAKSGVTKNIKNNMTIAGFPAIDIKKWRRNIAKINRG